MKYLALLVLVLFAFACENKSFDSDKRQILAKDEIRKMVAGNRTFTITGFKEDTLTTWRDSAIKKPIRYILDFQYQDSTGTLKNKQGIVLFSQQGNTVIDRQVVEH